MARFILRVDDCGWVPPDKTDDRGLEYFRKWRDAAGLAGLPVYYGFIPVTVGLREIDWLRDNLSGGEVVAVHGYCHTKGKEYTEAELARAIAHLYPSGRFGEHCTYIPPFNAYTRETISRWWDADVGGPHASATSYPVFFGGFPDDSQSVNLGAYPACFGKYCGTLHIPACRDLYDRAAKIIPRLDVHILEQGPHDPPKVVTLHATWDDSNLASVGALVERLKPHLVGAEAAMDWIQQRSPSA